MQSIHGMAAHPQDHQQDNQHHETMQQMQQQTLVNESLRQQHQSQQEVGEQQQQATMTVLESLEPAQQMGESQVLSLMDGQHQQQQQQHVVQHHLVQPINHLQQHEQHQPHLHQLQPGHLANSQGSMMSSNEEHDLRLSGQTSNSFRPRIQIEGIAADGGGPIVQWLMDNYEIADGESLPRSTVYNHYLAHCKRLRMASVNAASFGKLIRSVFVGLKTRRLGTRGHSKYHYFGVRAKQHIRAELLRYQEGAGCSRDFNNENSSQNTDSGESDSTVNDACGGRLSGSNSSKRIKRAASGPRRSLCPNQDHPHQNQMELDGNGVYYTNSNGYTTAPLASINNCGNTTPKNGYAEAQVLPNDDQYETADLKNHLGANWATLVDEHWPPVQQQQQLHPSMVVFEAKYKIYYKRMVELLSELKFLDVEQLWLEFWRPNDNNMMNQWSGQQQGTTSNGTNNQQESGSDISNQQHIDYQPDQQSGASIGHAQLTFNVIYQLTSQPGVTERIDQIDYSLYAAIESFLLPDMLSPIPRPLAQSIRMFAKNIGIWIEQAVKDYDPRFVSQKSKSARAFGYALRRYTSLNHLSTASRAIWERRSSLAQMSMDLSRVDLRDIEHQVSLMSHNNLISTNRLHSNSVQDLHQSSTTSAVDGVMSAESGNAQEQSNNTANLRPQSGQQNHMLPHGHHHEHQLCAMQPGQLIQNFLHLLEDPYPANSWPDWCKNLVESRVCGLSIDEARNFVLKWNFYISLIMKELTLRSAPSFGSFQLIRLLFDEYIFYLVVTRLAQAQHKTPAQLLSL